MNRRTFLKILTLGIAALGFAPDVMAQSRKIRVFSASENYDYHIKDYLLKMRNFDKPDVNDVKIGMDDYDVFQSTVMRIRRLEEYAGHGNFCLLSFDEGISMASQSSDVGPFSGTELAFMEKIFYTDAGDYGFFGEKTLLRITDSINTRDTFKVPQSGNYLIKGEPLNTYEKIKKQVGESVILTSGIRGVMKQFLLFLNKVYMHEGNLSLASRSLAPPGYSFHGKGDFDVGQIELGVDNFTARFATTEVFHKLSDLGYLKLRYPQDNMLGVRFEPWHIKTS